MYSVASWSKRGRRDIGMHGVPLYEGENRNEVETDSQQLLPGIPDALTVTKIAPKVHWEAVHNLVSVSTQWLKAIKNRCVYKERVAEESTDTLFVFQRRHSHCFAIYSMEENHVYHLPPIPRLPPECLDYCELVSLNGKLYVFTGAVTEESDSGNRRVVTRTNYTFVFDLVGRHGWTQLTSMPGVRKFFTCGFLNGKIYVFGGLRFNKAASRYSCDVYNVAEDKWTSISTPRFITDGRKAIAVGNELVLYSGRTVDGFFPWFEDRWLRPLRVNEFEQDEWSFYDYSVTIYNSITGEWRNVPEFTAGHYVILTIEGRLHRLSLQRLDVYDESHPDKWIPVQSFTGSHDNKMNIYSCTVVRDVLFVASDRENPTNEHLPIVYVARWTENSAKKPHLKERLGLRADMVLGKWEEVTCFLDKCEVMQLFDCPAQF